MVLTRSRKMNRLIWTDVSSLLRVSSSTKKASRHSLTGMLPMRKVRLSMKTDLRSMQKERRFLIPKQQILIRERFLRFRQDRHTLL